MMTIEDRRMNETDDSPRLQRAIDAVPSDVLDIPRGIYELATPLRVTNLCSLRLHKSAVLRAVRPMDYILTVDCLLQHDKEQRTADMPEDYNLFVEGGQLDGNGLASCMSLGNYHHFTLKDTAFLNGRRYGLRVDGFGHGYELIATNLYFKCVRPGLAGNTAVYTSGGDSHYTDCVVVDYTIGFHLDGGAGANRLTRCHVWGGPIPPPAPGALPEMLADSINFKIEDGGSILRDCYADTGQIGFYIRGDARLLGCSYFSNPHFKLDHITMIKHVGGRLLVKDARFAKTAPDVKAYEGCGSVVWQDVTYCGFGPADPQPGAANYPQPEQK